VVTLGVWLGVPSGSQRPVISFGDTNAGFKLEFNQDASSAEPVAGWDVQRSLTFPYAWEAKGYAMAEDVVTQNVTVKIYFPPTNQMEFFRWRKIVPEPTPTNGVWTGKVLLAWEHVGGTDIIGYNVYYGTKSRTYSGFKPTTGTTTTLTNLAQGVTYYFAVTSKNAAGLESAYSSEVQYP
jgi:hypothetical protein